MAGYYFNLPQITQLTIPQQAALNETKQIALSGGPGTGKSVVSLWRHISNYQKGKKSLLLTYTTTLARYLGACCSTQSQEAATNVGRSCKDKRRINGNWTEVIIDEAQDLSNNYYNDIININSRITYGADDSQILYPERSTKQAELKELFPNNIDYVLSRNFRSTQRIMQFAKVMFSDAYIPQATISGLANNVGELPIFLISNGNRYDNTNSKQDNSIIEIINSFRTDTHNIAILVPWQNDAQIFETVLRNNNIADFSIYYDDRNRFPDGAETIKNVHITTFKSAKGLEFDTVIIPNFHKYNEILGRYNISWQDYYVAVTRARSNLYLISHYDIPQLNTVTDKSFI